MKNKIEKIIGDYALGQKGISDCANEILLIFRKRMSEIIPKKKYKLEENETIIMPDGARPDIFFNGRNNVIDEIYKKLGEL